MFLLFHSLFYVALFIISLVVSNSVIFDIEIFKFNFLEIVLNPIYIFNFHRKAELEILIWLLINGLKKVPLKLDVNGETCASGVATSSIGSRCIVPHADEWIADCNRKRKCFHVDRPARRRERTRNRPIAV